ncbi:MAG: metal-dependent transcriptional regulator, partial [Nitrososphaera sp.]|nr:metal-dependent transcriptional regulator [Nitrososphaera sp.]
MRTIRRVTKPTPVKEDYLRAVFLLQEKRVPAPIRQPAESRGVKLVDIARYLKLSRSTVSERVQELVAQRYLKHSKYGQLSFTRRGFDIAKKLTHKHRLVEVFLHHVLHLSKEDAHTEAHQLEHA